ncbi:winged helix DNA-binding domain-containing protein [Streptomyces sp. MT29]|nr:winged helix DNA-binding domain-containing protein [Streptomyces sp. MT29]
MGGADPAAGGLRPAAAPAPHLPRRERHRALRPPRRPAPRPGHPGPAALPPRVRQRAPRHDDRSRVIPEVNKGRNGVGNQSYGTVLVDGFFEAVWRVERDGDAAILTVQPLRTLRRDERDGIAEEGVGMLSVMTDATSYDVRFGTFLDFGE